MFNPFRKKIKIPNGAPPNIAEEGLFLPTPIWCMEKIEEITSEELDALIDCVNTREDEGFDVTIARAAIEKLKR